MSKEKDLSTEYRDWAAYLRQSVERQRSIATMAKQIVDGAIAQAQASEDPEAEMQRLERECDISYTQRVIAQVLEDAEEGERNVAKWERRLAEQSGG